MEMIPKTKRYGVVGNWGASFGKVTFIGDKKKAISFKKVWGGTVYDGAYNWRVGDKKDEGGN